MAVDECDNSMYLYKCGKEADYFIILLDGQAVVQSGQDGMEINAGLFSYFGVDALLGENEEENVQDLLSDKLRVYKPDFSLRVNTHCVYWRVTRNQWLSVVKQSILEKHATQNMLILKNKSNNNLANANKKLSQENFEKKI